MADPTELPLNKEVVNQLPDWYLNPAQDFSGFIQDYLGSMTDPTSGVMGGYTGDRIASWDPYMSTAYGGAAYAGGIDDPYFQMGGDWMQEGYGNLGTAYDYAYGPARNSLYTGKNMITDQYSQIGNVDPFFQQYGKNTLGAARGYLADSATYDPAKMQEHLSPYISGVADEIERRGNENLFEDILPNINSTFVGAGQFGSTRNADFTNRAIRDTEREILGAQSNALNQSWGQAAQDYLGWAQQGANVGGGLNSIAGTYGQLGTGLLDRYTTGSNMGTSVANVGGQQGSLSDVLGNLAGSQTDMGGQYGTYGQTGANQQWSDINNLYGFGEKGFTYDQSILDNAYNDWMQRWQFPLQLAGGLTSLIPQYSNQITPDQSVWQAPPPAEENIWDDIGALQEILNGL